MRTIHKGGFGSYRSPELLALVCHHQRKEDYSKAMSFPTYPLATVPSAPVWFTFHSAEDFCPVDAALLLRLNYLSLRSRVPYERFELSASGSLNPRGLPVA